MPQPMALNKADVGMIVGATDPTEKVRRNFSRKSRKIFSGIVVNKDQCVRSDGRRIKCYR